MGEHSVILYRFLFTFYAFAVFVDVVAMEIDIGFVVNFPPDMVIVEVDFGGGELFGVVGEWFEFC